jgi:hypothetical protein
MEFAKHHVKASGNTTLRGFFNSDNVDFDPPSNSLRKNIMKAKARFVYELADGYTSGDEEDAIRDVMVSSENSYELIRLVAAIDGWDDLDDELPTGHIDPISSQLAQVLDQRDYIIYKLIRRYLILLDYNTSPTLGDCLDALMRWPAQYHKDEIDYILSLKPELLRGVASASMRDRTNMVNSARVALTVIQAYIALMPPRFNEVVALMHEVNYTTTIGAALVALNYDPLYAVVADMVNPSLTNAQRIACRDTCIRMQLEFSAAAKAVALVGSNESKSTVDRFMAALKAALDNFSPALPAPNAIAPILAALGAAGNTFAALITAITNLPDLLSFTLPDLLDTNGDDEARNLVSELHAQGLLPYTSFKIKLTLINAAIDGMTLDDDEIAILRVMEAAKSHDQAEMYQLVAGATWESLSSDMHGQEYNDLLELLQEPN